MTRSYAIVKLEHAQEYLREHDADIKALDILMACVMCVRGQLHIPPMEAVRIWS